MIAVGALVEATVQMMGTTATEFLFGRVTAVSGERVTVEGMVTVRVEPGEELPVEVEIPLTITVGADAVEVL